MEKARTPERLGELSAQLAGDGGGGCPVPLTSAAQNPSARRPDAKPNTQAQYFAVSESENVNLSQKIRQIAGGCVCTLHNALRFKKNFF